MNCPACQHGNRPTARFCDACGHSLKSGTVPLFQEAERHPAEDRKEGLSHFSPAPRAVADYTPRHLAEKILRSRSALEGERKQVTVLFADVKGSMDLAEQVDPESWHRILNRFFEILTDGVHRFEGTVNQYTGDGIMALFGAPITHEDHAHRACYAALHLRDALRDYAEALKRTEGLNFAVRMGINSGEVVVGKIGDDLRMDYTAQGHTVGMAARLEQLADPGKIHVSDETARLVAGFFRFRDLGSFRLKGVRDPVKVHELEGIGEMRTRLDVSRARGLSRFVGREEESRALDEAMALAEAGHAQAVSVVAEAGIGKSRLCYEFAERCRARGIAVRRATCVAHGRAIPYLPVLEFMRSFFGITDKDDARSARRNIAGTLLMQEEDFRESLPIIFEFLGVPDPGLPVPKMDPEARRRRLFEVIGRLIESESRRQPSVVLVEDLHWIDPGSEAFVKHLAKSHLGTKTLLLVNFRPEHDGGWLDAPFHRRIALRPLDPEAIAEFLRDQLGEDPSLRGLAGHIQARTAGNPFFVEEVLQSLIEGGTLAGSRGAYRLEKPLAEIAIPPTVQTLIAARIDRLPERDKQLLQTAAVIGKTFSERVLRDVAALPEADCNETLQSLEGAGFIYEESIFPEREFAFRHPLSQEVAYGSQLGDRRKQVHAAVARAIEKHAPEKLDERAALIAHHWEQAVEHRQAAQWHYRAAEWAGLRDPAAAFHHWRQMKRQLDPLPETPDTVGLSLVARAQTLNFAWRMGVPDDEAEALFRESDALAERHDLTRARAIFRFVYLGVKILAGTSEEAVRLGEEAVRMAEEIEDETLQRGTLGVLAYSYWMAGDPERAFELTARALANPPDDVKVGSELSGFSPYLYAMLVHGYCQRDLGRYAEAREGLQRAARAAEEHDEMEILSWALGGLITVAQMTGTQEDVLGWGRRSFEIADRLGSSFARVIGIWDLATAHTLVGNAAEARALYEEAIAISRETSAGRSMIPRLLAQLAEICLAQGDAEAARKHSDEAVRAVGKHLARCYEANVLISRARILLQTDGKEAADAVRQTLDRAARAVVETRSRCWEPFVHEERAALAGVLGDGAARRRELAEAERLFRGMGAFGHAERVHREISG